MQNSMVLADIPLAAHVQAALQIHQPIVLWVQSHAKSMSDLTGAPCREQRNRQCLLHSCAFVKAVDYHLKQRSSQSLTFA